MNTSNIILDTLPLPEEVYWDGKMEPISPPSSVLFSIRELTRDWFNDNFDIGLPSLLDVEEHGLSVKEIYEITEKLPKGDDVVIQLHDLNDEYMLDTKLLDYPIGIDVAQPHTITKVQEPLGTATTVFNPSSFDNAVLAQLTPPQSPPRESAASSPVHQQNTLFIESPNNFSGIITGIISPEPQSPASSSEEAIVISPNSFLNTITPVIVPNAVPTHFNFNWSGGAHEAAIPVPHETINVPASQNNNLEYERELQLLDEIVNTRAKELEEEWKANEESETQSSFSLAESMTSDDDWPQESCYSSSVSSPNCQQSSDEQMLSISDSLKPVSNGTSSATTKKRTRQYGRGIEDRKNRKKEQNKNAATRYRQRKKQEMESILVEELKLMEKNATLQNTLAEVKREAKYLKSLLREFYQSRKSKS